MPATNQFGERTPMGTRAIRRVRGSTLATAVAERPKPTQRAPLAACSPAGRGPIRVRRTTFSVRGSTSPSVPPSQAVTQTRPYAASTSNGTAPTRTVRVR